MYDRIRTAAQALYTDPVLVPVEWNDGRARVGTVRDAQARPAPKRPDLTAHEDAAARVRLVEACAADLADRHPGGRVLINLGPDAIDLARGLAADIAHQAETMWHGATHLTFRLDKTSAISRASQVHGIRRAGPAYVPAPSTDAQAKTAYAARRSLLVLLADLTTFDVGYEGLAAEPGGWYRLALYHLPGHDESTSDAAVHASAIVSTVGTRRAEAGRATVAAWLHQATPKPGTDTAPPTIAERDERGLALADIHHQAATNRTSPAYHQHELERRLTRAIVDVLHYADGWHRPEVVIGAAYAAPYVPDLAEPRDPRSLDVLATVIGDLLGAAEAAGQDKDYFADEAEAEFWADAEAERVYIIQAAREHL
ncbi:hypothetical protein [Streptomyces sp. HUAS TT7]|uniref:hypothetical protein n=1 Tax=Streptomyces sp. HUAS TT7 TaxID=3447507 RepID=UPI003F65642B